MRRQSQRNREASAKGFHEPIVSMRLPQPREVWNEPTLPARPLERGFRCRSRHHQIRNRFHQVRYYRIRSPASNEMKSFIKRQISQPTLRRARRPPAHLVARHEDNESSGRPNSPALARCSRLCGELLRQAHANFAQPICRLVAPAARAFLGFCAAFRTTRSIPRASQKEYTATSWPHHLATQRPPLDVPPCSGQRCVRGHLRSRGRDPYDLLTGFTPWEVRNLSKVSVLLKTVLPRSSTTFLSAL